MIYTLTKVVAAAGTAEPLSSTKLMVDWAEIKALKASGAANTGNIYVGTSSTAAAATGYPLTSGQTLVLQPLTGKTYIDLSLVYIDAGTSADAVKVIYGRG